MLELIDFSERNAVATPFSESLAEDNELLCFAADSTDADDGGNLAISDGLDPWWVLVVDDEPEVHAMTRLVLSNLYYNQRSIRLISAFSAGEAFDILRQTPHVALIVLDVVMESEHAGLHLVKRIREELANREVRIILRTGQPGQAPERDVIINYDINDYRSKAELTAQQLFSATVVALRSYEHINIIEANRRGLTKIIDASSSLFQQRSMAQFAAGALTQLCSLLNIAEEGILCVRWGDLRGRDMAEPYVLAGSGRYEEAINQPLQRVIAPAVAEAIELTLRQGQNRYHNEYSTLYLATSEFGRARDIVIYLQIGHPLKETDRRLVEVFSAKIAVGFDNVYLYEQLRQAQKATVVALAGLAEYKDTDTGEHVLRIADLCSATSQVLKRRGHFSEQLDTLFLEQIGMASMLHDVGKVGTPDAILKKPAKLDQDEWGVMKQHTINGGELLSRADAMVDGQSYLTLGAQIARHHHEWYDGSGYPDELAGEAIPLSARIVAVTDVFDALAHARVYKQAWPLEQTIAYIRERSGTQFDPRVVEALLEVIGKRTELEPVLAE